MSFRGLSSLKWQCVRLQPPPSCGTDRSSHPGRSAGTDGSTGKICTHTQAQHERRISWPLALNSMFISAEVRGAGHLPDSQDWTRYSAQCNQSPACSYQPRGKSNTCTKMNYWQLNMLSNDQLDFDRPPLISEKQTHVVHYISLRGDSIRHPKLLYKFWVLVNSHLWLNRSSFGFQLHPSTEVAALVRENSLEECQLLHEIGEPECHAFASADYIQECYGKPLYLPLDLLQYYHLPHLLSLEAEKEIGSHPTDSSSYPDQLPLQATSSTFQVGQGQKGDYCYRVKATNSWSVTKKCFYYSIIKEIHNVYVNNVHIQCSLIGGRVFIFLFVCVPAP